MADLRQRRERDARAPRNHKLITTIQIISSALLAVGVLFLVLAALTMPR